MFKLHIILFHDMSFFLFSDAMELNLPIIENKPLSKSHSYIIMGSVWKLLPTFVQIVATLLIGPCRYSIPDHLIKSSRINHFPMHTDTPTPHPHTPPLHFESIDIVFESNTNNIYDTFYVAYLYLHLGQHRESRDASRPIEIITQMLHLHRIGNISVYPIFNLKIKSAI